MNCWAGSMRFGDFRGYPINEEKEERVTIKLLKLTLFQKG